MSGLRTIKLGEREFNIPPLVIKQNLQVYPICIRLDLFTRAQIQSQEFNPTLEQFQDMCDAVFIGLARAAPLLTREEFDNLEVAPFDMFLAFLAVRMQTGAYRIVEKEGDTAEGEQPGVKEAA